MAQPDTLGHQSILKEMPQLDSLRAIAVLMVFAHHWLPSSYRFGFPWGESGVDLFFVLSGFLITGILLKCRRYVEEGDQSALYTARQFYIRRSLRIWPLYFSVLILYAVIAQNHVNWLTPWLWTFTLNLYRTFLNPEWGGLLSHYWSLAVEEQFYLVWPWVILFVPRRWLLPVLIGAVSIGTLTKIFMVFGGWPDRAIRFFTLSCLDTLAFGALLAYLVDRHNVITVARSKSMTWLFWISLPLVIIGLTLQTTPGIAWERMVLFMTAKACLFGWIIVNAAAGFRGALGRLLEFRPLMYLGKISFGLYVLHKPIPALLDMLGLPIDQFPPLLSFVLYAGIAVAIASLSWKFFEAPINGLKRRFPYKAANSVLQPTHQAVVL